MAGGADNRIRVWELVSRDAPKTNPLAYTRYAHEGTIVRLAFARDGKALVSAAGDRTIKLWETNGFTQTFVYEKQPDATPALALAPGGEAIVVGRMDGSLQAYAVQPPVVTEEKPKTVAPAPPAAAAAALAELAEQEPNDTPATATPITVPCAVRGVIHAARKGQKADADLYRFEAKAGQVWVLAINAARSKSPLDSRLEVLDAAGKAVPRLLLRAVRDSYFTFRGANSEASNDFRLHNCKYSSNPLTDELELSIRRT